MRALAAIGIEKRGGTDFVACLEDFVELGQLMMHVLVVYCLYGRSLCNRFWLCWHYVEVVIVVGCLVKMGFAMEGHITAWRY